MRRVNFLVYRLKPCPEGRLNCHPEHPRTCHPERSRGILSFLLGILLLCASPGKPVLAGDEDLISNPYTRFDPETGFFIPVEPPSADASQQSSQSHKPATQNTTKPPEPEQTRPENPVQTSVNQPPAAADTGNQALLMFAGVGILLAGIIFGFYKYHQKPK
jgi:hypothetical protein